MSRNRTDYGKQRRLPKKGSAKREVVRMLMRPRGMMSFESPYAKNGTFGVVLTSLWDDIGLDVRRFPLPSNGQPGAPPCVFKIVGWDRGHRYRSFTTPTLDTPAQHDSNHQH